MLSSFRRVRGGQEAIVSGLGGGFIERWNSAFRKDRSSSTFFLALARAFK